MAATTVSLSVNAFHPEIRAHLADASERITAIVGLAGRFLSVYLTLFFEYDAELTPAMLEPGYPTVLCREVLSVCSIGTEYGSRRPPFPDGRARRVLTTPRSSWSPGVACACAP